MKYFFLIFFLFAASVHSQEPPVLATKPASFLALRPAKKAKKNIVQLEALGRGVMYGIGYERMLGSDVSLGASFSYATVNGSLGAIDTTFRVMTVPLYVNYYVNPGRHNLVLTGGIMVLAAEASARASDSLVAAFEAAQEEESFNFGDLEIKGSLVMPIPQAGAGYEFRGSSGFITRANLYGMYALGQFVPWAGLSIGVAF